MEIALTIAVTILIILLVVMMAAYYRLRARLNRLAKRAKPPDGDDSSKRLAAGGMASPADGAALDIPAALVGARWKAIIERFALVLGTTPVDLLRAALVTGLTGGRPITEEMLDELDKLIQEGEFASPGKPGSARTH
jgi:hypothetical protein